MARHGGDGQGSVRQGVTWLANCGSFPQQVSPTVRWGMVGKGSARQGSVYQSGGIAKSSRHVKARQGTAGRGTARRGKARRGKARRGKARTLSELVAVTANLVARRVGAGLGRARQGLARFISHSIGDSET